MVVYYSSTFLFIKGFNLYTTKNVYTWIVKFYNSLQILWKVNRYVLEDKYQMEEDINF